MQLYIADYLADTMHLSTEEHGAYLLLMFNYWQTGKPLPKSRLAKIARLSNERWTTVEQTLNEFFNDTGTEWIHERIEADLEAVKAKQMQRSEAGKASAMKRKSKPASRASTGPATTVERSLQRPLNDPSNKRSTNIDTDIDIDTDLKPHTQNARAQNFPPPIENPPAAIPSYPPPANSSGGKFVMTADWEPDPDFQRRAALWGRTLDGPAPGYTAAELAEFTAYWAAEGKFFHQTQWEQKFSRHLVQCRASASRPTGRLPGGRGQPNELTDADWNDTTWADQLRDEGIL